MPDTQAFSVDWTVTIQPEGDVSDDVVEITIIEEEGINSATVTLDTSKQPHALEEQEDISITVDDGNTTKSFDGFTDSIDDDDTRPVVTVDARTPIGVMDDSIAVGDISEDNLFQVIDAIVDTTAGEVREITFDPTDLESQYGTFGGSTVFGSLDVVYSDNFNYTEEDFEQQETSDEGKEAEIVFDFYDNNTGTTYTLDITGNDKDGNTVTASLDLPDAGDASTAFGDDTVKLALSGGNELWDEVTSISTDIPDNPGGTITFGASIQNYVKTDWDFSLNSLTSVRAAVSRVVQYMSGIDNATDWEFFVDQANDELIVQPTSDSIPERYVFREGDNVLKPVASRDLDGVRNFVKVLGQGGINFWAWAYDGDLQWSLDDPFESGEYPDSGVVYDSSPGGGQNDIDQINIRGEKLQSDTFTSYFQLIDIGKEALKQLYRTPVTGQAPVSGVHPATPGDEAEVFYPSRGIPQKVADNVYQIEKVETRVTPESAKTLIDFGSAKPTLADQMGAGSSMIRNDISNNVSKHTTTITSTKNSTTEKTVMQVLQNFSSEDVEKLSEFVYNISVEDAQDRAKFPITGTLDSQNSDGTWEVTGDDSNTYSDVEVI